MTDFHEIWYLRIFRKSVAKIQVSLKSDKNNGYFTWRPICIFWSYLAQFFLEWEMFRTKVVQKIKTHILCSVTLSRKSYRLWDNVEKYCREGQATDDNTAHAHCMLNDSRYKHALRICNTYCFSSATMAAQTRLNATFIRQLPVLSVFGLTSQFRQAVSLLRVLRLKLCTHVPSLPHLHEFPSISVFDYVTSTDHTLWTSCMWHSIVSRATYCSFQLQYIQRTLKASMPSKLQVCAA